MSFDFEQVRSIWDRLADAWDRNRAVVWRFLRPATEDLVRLIDPKPGETILEVGTGPGDTGLLIAEQLGPTGRMICTDLSETMLERARAAAARIGLQTVEFRQMNAQALSLPDDSVDAVIGRLIYHLLPDPAAAFREARRVLRPGGRLCFTVFGPDEHMRFDGALRETTALCGLSLPPGLSIDVPLNDPSLIHGMLLEAGFTAASVSEIGFVIDFPDGEAMWSYITEMYGRQAEMLRTLTDEQRDAFRATLLEQLAPYRDPDGGFAIPGLALNARAVV